MLQKHLRNTLLHFLEVLYKRGDLKNSSKFPDKKQPFGGVLSNDVPKSFAKFTIKHLCLSLFLNKAAGWKAETVRSSCFKIDW